MSTLGRYAADGRELTETRAELYLAHAAIRRAADRHEGSAARLAASQRAIPRVAATRDERHVGQ